MLKGFILGWPTVGNFTHLNVQTTKLLIDDQILEPRYASIFLS